MNLEKLKKQDFVITIVLSILLVIGSLIIYASTYNTESSDLLTKQIILITIGLFIYFSIIIVDINWFKVPSLQLILYVLIILTLLYANTAGETIAGTNRWINLGFFSFQPSEYAKVLIIMFVALMFSKENLPDKNREYLLSDKTLEHGFSNLIKSYIKDLWKDYEVKSMVIVIIYVLPIAFLTFIQPALGNTIIIMALTVLTLFFSLKNQWVILRIFVLALLTFFIAKNFISFDIASSGFFFTMNNFSSVFVIVCTLAILVFAYYTKTKLWALLAISFLTVLSLLAGIFSWNNILGDYQQKRILTYLEGPEADPLGSGYQIIQSKIAIGSGQLWGRGYLQGTQSSLHILTQAHTDFAFASMSEQFGFIGASLLLLIYLFLILRILKIAKETKSDFGRIVCFGAVSLLLIHIFINVGMNMGKLPVTGIPLPLVSYGGSSVLMTLIVIALVQSVYASRRPVDMADSLMLTSLKGKDEE